MAKHITSESLPEISNLNRDEAGADQYFTPGLLELALQAVVFLSIMFMVWGGKTEDEKVATIGTYHRFPKYMKKLQDKSGIKHIVMTHVQNYKDPEDFDRLSVPKEMQHAGVKSTLLAEDGDLY
jgi:hypothetical protein